MGLKTKTVCVKKQRKLSKNIVHQQEASNGDEIHDTLLDTDADDKIVTGQSCNKDSSKVLGGGRWYWFHDFVATFGVNERPIYIALRS